MPSTTSEPVMFQHPKIFRAGAGAGKTTSLIGEVYSFYKNFCKTHKREPRVVLTTFTRKATQELKERLMLEAQKNNDQEFLNFVLSKNSLMISTIHGVLQIFLRQYAQLIDLDPGFRIIDNVDVRKQSKSILRNLLKRNFLAQDLLDEFTINELTRDLLHYNDAQLLTGQLQGYTLFDFENSFKKIIDLFSRRSLELSARILEESQKEKWMEYAKVLKTLSGDFVNNISFFLEYKKPTFSKKDPPVSEDLNAEIEEFKSEIKKMDPIVFDKKTWQSSALFFQNFETLAKEFHREINMWKKHQGNITISDLELYALELIRQKPLEIQFFSESFDYWLIDEFQDTSPLQVQLLEKFMHQKPHFVVGDPQQSIYFFRGARVQVFEDMQKKIVQNNGDLKTLRSNYRSQKNLMDFINYFFINYKKPFEAMESLGEDSLRKNVARICLAENEEAQLQAIFSEIQSHIQDGVLLNQICILGRNNDDLKKIALALQKQKIPYVLHSASGFQERREIQDALSILKFLINPHDNFNLIQLLRSPWFAIKDEDIIRVTLQRPESFWLKFCEYMGRDDYSNIAKLKKYLNESHIVGISHAFEKILIENHLLDLSFYLDSSGRRESNLWKLLVQLKTEDHEPSFQFLDFIERRSKSLSLDEDIEDADAISSIEPNSVQLMTVHKSKGLEFDHVIIPYIDKAPQKTKMPKFLFDENAKKFGLALKLDQEENLVPLPAYGLVEKIRDEETQESDRLLYVAMTRAKKTLMLATSGTNRTKDSWLQNIQIPLLEGEHAKNNFSYLVEGGPWSHALTGMAKQFQPNIDPQLFDLNLLKKAKSSAVTTEIQKIKTFQKENIFSSLEKAEYGRWAHRAFEALKYKKSISHDARLQKSIDFILKIQDVPFQKILNEGFAEWGFVLKTPEGNTSGQIDLWSLVDNTLWVIDYKTGTSKFQETAFLQLERYREVLKEFLKSEIKNTKLVALYPFEQKYFVKEV